MFLTLRLIRASIAFGIIFASYMIQLALARLLRRTAAGGEHVVPPFVERRRARVDETNAKRLLRAILRLRGVFIKLGQILSIMGGFLPRVYGKELEQLQDRVPPHRFSEFTKVFEREFSRSADELFRTIEREPIAAASLGQVHVAHTKDGRKMAVKMLYPGIRGVITVDLRVIRWGIRIYQHFVPVARLDRIHASLVDLLRRETDYLHEAQMIERMAKNFEGDPNIAFPEVVHELTTRDVLTMTFMEGIKITKLDELRRAGVRTDAVALTLIQAFYKMLFVDRFFHADPHPGNFLVEPLPASDPRSGTMGGRLVILDFGAICEARPELIDGLIEILKGFFSQDDSAVLRGFRRMGFVAEGGNEPLLERTVKDYFARLLKIRDRSAAALMRASPDQLQKLMKPDAEGRELAELARSFEYPEDWFYVERACVVMFWLSAQIDPELDTIMAGFPFVMPLLQSQSQTTGAPHASRE